MRIKGKTMPDGFDINKFLESSGDALAEAKKPCCMDCDDFRVNEPRPRCARYMNDQTSSFFEAWEICKREHFLRKKGQQMPPTPPQKCQTCQQVRFSPRGWICAKIGAYIFKQTAEECDK